MDQDNGEKNKTLTFLAKKVLFLGVFILIVATIVLIVATILWGLSFITTRLFIALAMIGGLLIFLSILFLPFLFFVLVCIFNK